MQHYLNKKMLNTEIAPGVNLYDAYDENGKWKDEYAEYEKEWSDDLLFFKIGWIYHFNAIPSHMGKCGDWIKLTYEKLYKK